MYQRRGLGLSVSTMPTVYDTAATSSGINWNDVISQAIDTAGHILKPSAYPQYPVYDPAGAAVVGVAQSPGIWILGAGLLALVLLRK